MQNLSRFALLVIILAILASSTILSQADSPLTNPYCTASTLATNSSTNLNQVTISGNGNIVIVGGTWGGATAYSYGTVSRNLLNTYNNVEMTALNLNGNSFAYTGYGNETGQNADSSVELFLRRSSNIFQLSNYTNPETGVVAISPPSINNNGDRIAFMVQANASNSMGETGIGGFYVWKEGIGIQRLVASDTERLAYTPIRISPDGQYAVFLHTGNLTGTDPTNRGAFYRINLSTNAITHLFNLPNTNSEGAFPINYFVINQDGQIIAFDGYVWDAISGLQTTHGNYPMGMTANGSSVVFQSYENITGENADGSIDLFILHDSPITYSQISNKTSVSYDDINTFGTAISQYGEKIVTVQDAGLYNQIRLYTCPLLGMTNPRLIPAPTHLRATEISQDTISLAWEEYLGGNSIRVEMRYGGGDWEEFYRWSEGGESLTLSGLQCNTPYQFRVIDYWSNTEYSYSGYLTVTTSPCELYAPSDLSVTFIAQERISLTWTINNTKHSGFIIERGFDGINWNRLEYINSKNTTSHTFYNLQCGTQYYFRIRATLYKYPFPTQYSESSNLVFATTPSCDLLPIPSLSISDVSQTRARILWVHMGANESAFSIERSVDGLTWEEIARPASNIYSYYDETLNCNTTYFFRIRAYRSSDDFYSEYSNIGSLTSYPCQVLDVPPNFQASSIYQTRIIVSWSDVETETLYYFQRSTDNVSWLTTILGENVNSYTHNNLSCGTNYYYRVRAYRSSDNFYSDYAVLQVSTTACNEFPAPTNLTIVSLGQSSINLSWGNDAYGEIAYELERSLDGTNWIVIRNNLAGNASSYNDTNLSCETHYYYRVRAYRSSDMLYSEYSNIIDGVTSYCNPATPTNLEVSNLGQTTVSMTWTDNASTETGYAVYRSLDGQNYSIIANLGINANSFTDTSLSCGTRYYYKIKAIRDNFSSSFSTFINIRSYDCATGNPIPETICSYRPITAIPSYDSYVYLENFSPEAYIGGGLEGGVVELWNLNTRARHRVFEDRGGNLQNVFYSNQNLTGDNPDGSYEIFFEHGSDHRLSQRSNFTNPEGGMVVISPTGGESFYSPLAIIDFNAQSVSQPSGNDVYYYAFNNGSLSLAYNLPPTKRLALIPSFRPDNYYYDYVIFTHTGNLTGHDPNHGGAFYRYNFVSSSVQHLFNLNISEIGDEFPINRIAGASRIVFDSTLNLTGENPDGNREIFMWDGTIKQITSTTGFNQVLDTSYVGSHIRILFQSDHNITGENPDGDIEYFIYDIGTQTIHQITNHQGVTYAIAGYALDETGTVALVVQPNELGQATVYEANCGHTIDPVVNAPSNLRQTSATMYSINFSWHDNSTEERGYWVERSADGINWFRQELLSSNSTSYSDTDVSCGNTFYYRVYGINYYNWEYAPVSEVLTATSYGCNVNTPSNLVASSAPNFSINLTWQDNSNDEQEFHILYSIDNGTNWNFAGSVNRNITSFTHSNLICDTTYTYRLWARRDDGRSSGYSNLASAISSACPVFAPSNIISIKTVSSISLNWQDNASNETAYELQKQVYGVWQPLAIVAANTTSYSDNLLQCGTNHVYRLRAINETAGIASAWVTHYTNTSTCTISATQPNNRSFTSSYNSITLTWQDTSYETNYEIQKQVNGIWQAPIVIAGDSSSYVDTNLICQTNYAYRLRAINQSLGAYSAWASINAYTDTCPPLTSPSLSMTGNAENSINLAWSEDASATVTSYQLSRFTGNQWIVISSLPPTTLSYSHTGLACGQTYQYRVQALRSTDNISFSSSAMNFSTAACAPVGVPSAPTLLNSSSSMISLQIPALPATATSFNLERSLDASNWAFLGTAMTGTYMDTAVTCGQNYYYRLSALRATDGQVSAPSSPVLVTTPVCPAPSPASTIGIYRAGQWSFVQSNNTLSTLNQFSLGDATWQPLIGDWNGDGQDGVGIYRNGTFVLQSSVAGQIQETSFNFGTGQGQAIVGDWNGDGVDSVGIYHAGVFILSDDNLTISYQLNLGDAQAGWIAVVGDWNGNHSDEIGLYKEGVWLLVESVLNPMLFAINYGPAQAGWLPVVGDWNGDGVDTIGLFNNGLWRLRYSSNHSGDEMSIVYGAAGDIPLAGYEGIISSAFFSGSGSEIDIEIGTTPFPTIVPPEPELTPEVTPEVTPES